MISEGLRIWRRARRVKRTGFKRYKGGPEQICRKILEDCFDGYFRVSAGHFCEFYTRDFGLIAHALCELGYKEKVTETFAYALKHFSAAGKVATTISPDGNVFDFPTYSPDSLALLLFSLVRTKNQHLAKQYSAFLQEQVDVFVKKVVAKDLLPKRKHFSSIRDQVKRKSSCYDAVMIAAVARDAKKLGLAFPHEFAAVKKRIREEYWNGTYFFSDLHKQDVVVGDANVFPFWMEVFTEKNMVENATAAIRAAGLDDPYPLRYVSTADKHREKRRMHHASWTTPEYETDSIWMHLGLAYLEILPDTKLRKKHLRAYTKNILTFRTFLEVYAADGTPYESAFYMTDEAMSWCAVYLILTGGKNDRQKKSRS